MKKIIVLGYAFFALFAANTVLADNHTIKIEKPWARPTIGEAKVTAIYMKATNQGKEDDILIKAKSPIGNVEIHQTITDGGVMKMLHVDKLALPAGKTVLFAQGGLHLMVTNVKGPLVKGKSFPVTLIFERAGEKKVTVPVK